MIKKMDKNDTQMDFWIFVRQLKGSVQERPKWRFGSIFFLLQSAQFFACGLLFSQRTSLYVFFRWILLRFQEKTGRKTRSASFVFFCAKQKQKKTIKFFCFVKINEAVQSRVDMNNKGTYC